MMATYHPVTCCRSDGQVEVLNKAGARELNQPPAHKLNASPDANGNVDYFKKLEHDSPKAIDWKRKLGGMLIETIGTKDERGKKYILSELPQGYVLYEHIKLNSNRKAEKSKHAGGNFDRQDAYLYGHPQGRQKRYRSPADFFPHLLWMTTDQEGDSRNCSCKWCSPDEKDTEDDSKVEIMKEKLSTSGVVKNIPALTKAVPATFGNRSLEQRADSDANGKFLYRPGELVWFSNGANWRLGVIAKRQLLHDRPRYLLQPLSNPLQHQASQIKEHETDLRPWLAWSVPSTTIEALNNSLYEQVPWERVVRGEFDGTRHRDYVVDGSILAAKQIDSSYTLFDRIDSALVGPGEVHYSGMFLGAEKVWVGEPIRLRTTGNDVVVMIVSKLIEQTSPPNTSMVTFVGDVYKFVEMPMPYKSRSEWPTPDLPPRMVLDLRFRNQVADMANKGIWYEWRLLEPAAKKSLADAKGRWYETRTLLPILKGADKFQQDLAKGITSDAGSWMNGRRDKNPNPELRRKNRRDTLGGAVPADFKVSRGLDGQQADDAFPDTQPVTLPGYVESDIDQFMNF